MTNEALVLQSSPIITAGYIMQVLISLAVVVTLIYVIAKFLLPRMPINAPGRLIKVIDRLMLEPQVAAYVLKVGKRAWLIVSSGKNVVKVDEIGEEDLSFV